MHCRECRFSEGQAEEAGGRTALRLYCSVTGGRAIEVCAVFAPMVHEVRDAYEMTDQVADVLEGGDELSRTEQVSRSRWAAG